MFYVDINAEVENQQAAKEVGKNIYSYNGKSCCDVKDISTPLRMPKMSTSKVSPKTSPSIKHRLIKNESINDDDEDDDVNESLFPRCKSSKYFMDVAINITIQYSFDGNIQFSIFLIFMISTKQYSVAI